MIKKLEITNFESHKSTVFEFGPGFNCIHGKSNHGKSSVLRALELAGYGVWAAGENKKKGIHGPVRIGSSACEIYVESDLGSVKVRRGKGVNEWEIKDSKTGETVNFQNPGSGSIPQAQAILGLESMDIAGNSIRFNWSDQRDKHFLIDEVEGKNSSPSFVAAVLDEVGGLSGCEDLIRSLASDKSKFEQQMKKAGEEAIKVEEELEKYNDLDSQLNQAAKAEKILLLITEKRNQVTRTREIKEKIYELKIKLKTFIDLDSEIKNREQAEELFNQANLKFSVFNKVSQMNIRLMDLSVELTKAKNIVSEIEKIDLISAQNVYNKSKELINSAKNSRKLYAQMMRKKGALDRVPKITIDFEIIEKSLNHANKKICELAKLEKSRTTLGVLLANLTKIDLKLKQVNDNFVSKKEELETLLKSTGDICPFCNQEMSIKCKEEILAGV